MKHAKIFILYLVLMSAFLVSCGPDLDSDKGKYSYAIGQKIGSGMKRDGLELDLNAFKAAMEEALAGKESKLNDKEINAALQKMQMMMQKQRQEEAQANLKAGKEYLEKNKEKEGVKVTNSGLQYRVIKEGTGKHPKENNLVKVNYRGTLIDGTEFDSSFKRHKPAEFAVNRVIRGWTEGLQLMKVGGKYEFTVPSMLAYGPRGTQNIPGNSVLIFEVELLDVKDNPAKRKK
jgi:FKBP-type peptidyl-prolyl cis-trans isomerase FklB